MEIIIQQLDKVLLSIIKYKKRKDSFFWLYLLASCWYGFGLVVLISLPFIWGMSSGSLQETLYPSTLSLTFLFPWAASLVILWFTMRDLIKKQSGGALLTALHILCALTSLLIWWAIGAKATQHSLSTFPPPAVAYMVIGATVGVLTMGLVFTSFIPILCTCIGVKIMGQRPTLSLQRLFGIFLVFLPGWLLLIFTGFIFGNA